jgi:DnaJ-class molecular chaperone
MTTFTACCGAPCPPEGGRCERCKDNSSAVRECEPCEGEGHVYVWGNRTLMRVDCRDCAGTGVVPVEGT